MDEIEKAIEYIENAITELEAGILVYSAQLKDEFIEQKHHFETALIALKEKQERDKGCEYCRGWDKRSGANYCPMCGRKFN